MLWQNNFSAFIAGEGKTGIVIFALVTAAISVFFLFTTILGLIKKLRPEKILLKRIPLLFMVFIILLGFSSYVSTTPTVCGSCHIMRQAIRDLGYTKHGSIGCMACHKKANLLGLPLQNISQVRMAINNFSGAYDEPISTTVTNDVCLECHNSLKKGVKPFKKIKVSHKEMIKERIACIECHDDIAHQKRFIRISMMEKCSGCHNNEKASARCRTCHMEKVKLGVLPTGDWSIVHGENWPELHGTKDLNTCVFCHEKKYCGKCHATVVPHPEGWSYIHGDEAATNRSDCKSCHKDESSCIACHKVEMPHPVSWISIHDLKIKAAGEKSCKTCHRDKDCVDCHKNHKESVNKMRKGIR